MLPKVELSAPLRSCGRSIGPPTEGDAVAHYRIYMLDLNHRIVTGSDADCQNDEAALAWAAITLGSDARAEVWQGSRILGRVANVSIPLDAGHALAATGD
jgi:hypothetical protein